MGPPRRHRTRRQYRAPRGYLQRFTADGDRVWAYDKFRARAYRANITAAVGNGPHSVEALDGDLPNAIKCVLDCAEAGRLLDRDARGMMAVHVAAQLLRTRAGREGLTVGLGKVARSAADGLARMARDAGCDDLPRVQSAALLVEHVLVAHTAPALARHYWVVWKNATGQPFYTSGHPIACLAHGRPAGATSPGVVVVYPLSPVYLLAMYDRPYFTVLAGHDGRGAALDRAGVDLFNERQVLGGGRWVFCNEDRFEQAAEVCRRHPWAAG